MSDRSFIRFGGYAGLLLALASWSSVVVYYTLVPAAQRLPVADTNAFLASLSQDSTGTPLFYGLYALLSACALVGLMAVYFRLSAVGGAWLAFGTLVGMIASALTVLNGMDQVAFTRYLGTLYPAAKDLAVALYNSPAPVNPLNTITAGLTAPWFLIVSLVILHSDLPKLLGYLGLVCFADLAVGFLTSVFGVPVLPVLTALIAGAVGGPLFWVWLGALLIRERGETAMAARGTAAAARGA